MLNLSYNNRNRLEEETYVSCYFCFSYFYIQEVTEYNKNNSALCPHCEMNTLLPGIRETNEVMGCYQLAFLYDTISDEEQEIDMLARVKLFEDIDESDEGIV